MYPVYVKVATMVNLEALVAASKFGKAVPMNWNSCVIARAEIKLMSQKMKKAWAVYWNLVMKYSTILKCEIWKSMIGISVMTWAKIKADGWWRAKSRCLAKTGRPTNESVTSARAMKVGYSREKKSEPLLMNKPAVLSGVL